MRVLTVRQPWAWVIIHGGKDVENRVRSLGPYRGLVAIHAGTHKPGRLGQRTMFDNDLEVERDRGGLLLRSKRLAWPYRLPLGYIIGVVDLTDVHESRACEVEMQHVQDGPVITWRCSLWSMPDHFHLTLDNPRPLARPIPATGRLGLWRPDADLAAAIREQLSNVPHHPTNEEKAL